MIAKTYLLNRGEQRQNYRLLAMAVLLALSGIGLAVLASTVFAGVAAGSANGLNEQDWERQRVEARLHQKEISTDTPASCPLPSFSPPSFFGVGSQPSVAAVGDFNRDGSSDLAVANMSSNNISVLLGNGNGGFGTPTNFAVGNNPQFVATGDFNRDGNPDLVSANTTSANVSVLLGNGAGGFGAATNVVVGSEPRSIVVGDFNRDGNLDLAVVIYPFTGVAVLLGNGNGGFGTPTNFPTGNSPRSIAMGDFNRDGNLDLAVANAGVNNVSVLLGNGAGGFGAAANFGTGNVPRWVSVGDFNSDENLDLVTANAISGDVSVLLGNGAGGFGAAANFAVGDGPSAVVVGDFNRDRESDLAATSSADGNLAILLGNGNGGFGTPTNFDVGDDVFSATVDDFNRDGGPDLIVVRDRSNDVAVMLNTCACAVGPDYQVATSTNATMIPANNFVAGSGCNDCTVNVALPFAYTLYDITFNSVNVSSEGNLQFVSNSPSGNNACLPTNTLNYTIMPYWNDLNTNINDNMGVYTSTIGTAPNRIFVMRWSAGQIASDATFNFEVLLYEGQPRFDFIYGNVTPRGFSATIGVQEGAGSRYTQYSCNTQSINTGTRLTFDRRACPGLRP